MVMSFAPATHPIIDRPRRGQPTGYSAAIQQQAGKDEHGRNIEFVGRGFKSGADTVTPPMSYKPGRGNLERVRCMHSEAGNIVSARRPKTRRKEQCPMNL